MKLLLVAFGIFSSSFQQNTTNTTTNTTSNTTSNATATLNTTVVQTLSNCVNSTWLSKFGLTARTSPAVVSGNICQGFYDVGGACADHEAVRTYLVNLVSKYRSRAIDAQDLASLLSLADVYFGAVNRNQTLLNTPVTTGLGGIFDSIVNTLTKVFATTKDFFQDLWKNATAWVLRIFNKTSGAINPCFQAWARLSNGGMCALTSNNNLTKEAVAVGTKVFYRFQTNLNTTGTELAKCLPLIDNYCVLTYGISISDSANFNRTFNWADSGLSRQACLDLQTNYNCTSVDCQTNTWTILINNFNSEDMPFVRDPSDITALYNFLKQNTIQQPSAYVPVSKNTLTGVVLSPLVGGNEFVQFGTKANLEVGTFTTDQTKLTVSKTAFVASMSALVGVMMLLSR